MADGGAGEAAAELGTQAGAEAQGAIARPPLPRADAPSPVEEAPGESRWTPDVLPVEESPRADAHFPNLDAYLTADSGKFWKGLIDTGGIGAQYRKLERRVRVVEERPERPEADLAARDRALSSRLTQLVREAVEQCREEARRGLAEHAAKLEQVPQLETLVRTLAHQMLPLMPMAERLSATEESLADLVTQIQDAEQERLKFMLDPEQIPRLRADLDKLQVPIRENFETLSAAIGRQRDAAEAAASQLQEQVDRLSAELEESRRVSAELERVSLPKACAAAVDECKRHAERLAKPILPEALQAVSTVDHRLRHEMQTQENVTMKRFNTMEKKYGDSIQWLKDNVPSYSVVSNLDDKLKSGIHAQSMQFVSLTDSVSEKIREVIERTNKLQAAFDDHEHALRHHAEELVARSTRYDVLMCYEQLEKCATQTKVKTQLKRVDRILKGQAVALDEIMQRYHMRHPSSTVKAVSVLSDDEDEDRFEDEADAEVRKTIADAAKVESESPPLLATGSASPDIECGWSRQPSSQLSATIIGATELYHRMRQQLESVAQGLLVLGQVTARSASGTGARKQRADHESQVLHQLSCLLHWVTHQSAPAGWEPAQLECLAYSCSQTESEIEASTTTQLGKLSHGLSIQERCFSTAASTLLAEASLLSLAEDSTDTVNGHAGSLLKGSLVRGRPPQRRPASTMSASPPLDSLAASTTPVAKAERAAERLPSLPYVQAPSFRQPATAR